MVQTFGYRQVLGLMAAKFLTDSAWYFFIFWLPKYLGDVRHLNIKQIGTFAWIPFAFAGLGSLSGGWLSSYLIRRNVSLDHARKIALGFSALLLPASLFIVASPLSLAIVFFSMAMFAHQFWSANVQTLPADVFPSQVVGSVEGLLGSAGSFGGHAFRLARGALDWRARVRSCLHHCERAASDWISDHSFRCAEDRTGGAIRTPLTAFLLHNRPSFAY
jgi:ACS family hexuronate transporter-like MFS transporter